MISPNLFIILASIVVLVQGINRTVENSCPDHVMWKRLDRGKYLHIWEDWCIWFAVESKGEHAGALAGCGVADGYLVMPKTEEFNNFLADQLLNTYEIDTPIWIGLHDTAEENHFVWADNTSLGDWNNFAFGNGPGNLLLGEFEDCVTMQPGSGVWEDRRCAMDWWSMTREAFRTYICQFPIISNDD